MPFFNLLYIGVTRNIAKNSNNPSTMNINIPNIGFYHSDDVSHPTQTYNAEKFMTLKYRPSNQMTHSPHNLLLLYWYKTILYATQNAPRTTQYLKRQQRWCNNLRLTKTFSMPCFGPVFHNLPIRGWSPPTPGTRSDEQLWGSEIFSGKNMGVWNIFRKKYGGLKNL